MPYKLLRNLGLLVFTGILVLVAFAHHHRKSPRQAPGQALRTTTQDSEVDTMASPWTRELVPEPVSAQTLITGAMVEYYDIYGNTPEELAASLDTFGTQRQGAPAVTSYQMMLYKGGPTDKACGFSQSSIQADITILMPRWQAMSQATDEAKQWWSYQIRALADQHKQHIERIRKEAEEATPLLRAANCATGEAAFAEFNHRLAALHGDAAFSSNAPDLRFYQPGSIVETVRIPPSSVPPRAKPSAPEAASPDAYNLDLRSLTGNTVSLQDYKGRVLFLNFWATWCGPCKAEMPSIARLYARMKNTSILFACISNENAAPIQSYVAKSGLDLPLYIGAPKPSSVYRVGGLPTTFIVSKTGAVALRHAGSAEWDSAEIEKFLVNLNNE